MLRFISPKLYLFSLVLCFCVLSGYVMSGCGSGGQAGVPAAGSGFEPAEGLSDAGAAAASDSALTVYYLLIVNTALPFHTLCILSEKRPRRTGEKY